MPKGNEQARHAPKKTESITKECPIVVTDSSSLNVPSQKRKERKEDAEPILYINRV
jgi:hypothetical protein